MTYYDFWGYPRTPCISTKEAKYKNLHPFSHEICIKNPDTESGYPLIHSGLMPLKGSKFILRESRDAKYIFPNEVRERFIRRYGSLLVNKTEPRTFEVPYWGVWPHLHDSFYSSPLPYALVIRISNRFDLHSSSITALHSCVSECRGYTRDEVKRIYGKRCSSVLLELDLRKVTYIEAQGRSFISDDPEVIGSIKDLRHVKWLDR